MVGVWHLGVAPEAQGPGPLLLDCLTVPIEIPFRRNGDANAAIKGLHCSEKPHLKSRGGREGRKGKLGRPDVIKSVGVVGARMSGWSLVDGG